MKREVFIPIEVVTRELDGKLLMANHLAHAGYNVYIGSKGAIKREVLARKNCIYIPKSITVEEISFYKQLKEQGTKICMLHAEGGVFSKDEENAIKMRYPSGAMEYLDTTFVNGNALRNLILKHIPELDSNKIIVSGDPRFDLLKKKYAPFFESKSKEIKSTYGDYILINTSFSAANPYTGIEWLKNYWGNNPDFPPSIKKELLHKMEVYKEVLSAFTKMIAEVSIKFKEMNFIIRPHPGEDPNYYIKRYTSNDNIYIRQDGNVVEWILNAKGVIHYDCTTGIESFIAGKPVISYVPFTDTNIVAWLPLFVSKQVKSMESLIKEVEDIMDISFVNNDVPKKTHILQQYFANLTVESSKLISDSLDSLIFKESSRFISKKQLYKLFFQRFKDKINSYRIKAFSNEYKHPPESRMFNFTKNHIAKKNKDLLFATNSCEKITEKIISKNLFLIKKTK